MQISRASEDVAGEVRAWMGRRRRSGASVAAELGWTEVYLSRRLAGRVPFDVADLAALAALLDVPVTAFFTTPEGGLMFDNTCGAAGLIPGAVTCDDITLLQVTGPLNRGLGGARGRDCRSLGVAVDAAAGLTRSVTAGNDPGGSRPARRRLAVAA
jgi:transcriptional regulator with XRE-family HTH domain